MKKLSFLLATLLIGGLMLTGCNKDPQPTPTPEPEPTPDKVYTVEYKILNDDLLGHTMADCFKINVTYIDANGESVTETDKPLPWIKTIEVKAPFHAQMSGTFTYNEADLPETFGYGQYLGIVVSQGNTYLDSGIAGGIVTYKKEKFLLVYGSDPDKLKFDKSKDIN